MAKCSVVVCLDLPSFPTGRKKSVHSLVCPLASPATHGSCPSIQIQPNRTGLTGQLDYINGKRWIFPKAFRQLTVKIKFRQSLLGTRVWWTRFPWVLQCTETTRLTGLLVSLMHGWSTKIEPLLLMAQRRRLNIYGCCWYSTGLSCFFPSKHNLQTAELSHSRRCV